MTLATRRKAIRIPPRRLEFVLYPASGFSRVTLGAEWKNAKDGLILDKT